MSWSEDGFFERHYKKLQTAVVIIAITFSFAWVFFIGYAAVHFVVKYW